MKLFHGWQVFVGLHQENLPPPPVFICRNYHRLPVVVFLVVRFLHFHLPGEMRIHKCISFVEECKWLLNDHGKRATDFSLEGFFGTLCCKEWTEHFYLHIEKVQTMDCMWGCIGNTKRFFSAGFHTWPKNQHGGWHFCCTPKKEVLLPIERMWTIPWRKQDWIENGCHTYRNRQIKIRACATH